MSERFARISERAVRCRELSGSDWRVLTCISLHADASGRAYPGMTTIAEMTGLRRQDVPRTIRRLERLGLLRCDTGAGPGGANVYTLLLDGEGASARLRTVRNGADSECPQDCGHDVRNGATKMSARLRTKHTNGQTNQHIRAGDDGAGEWFDKFWSVYPNRGDQTNPKKPAREKFLGVIRDGADPATIVRGAVNYARAMGRHRGRDRQYVKQAVSWLNDGLWDQYQDSPAAAQPRFGGMV